MGFIDVRQLLKLLANIKIRFRRGTSVEWAERNPVLDAGEPGVETNTLLFKIGDGVTPWNSLGYPNAGGGEPVDLPDLTVLYENAKV